MTRPDRTRAARQRAHRRRKREGLMMLPVAVPTDLPNACVLVGWIDPEDLEDKDALARKLGAILDALVMEHV